MYRWCKFINMNAKLIHLGLVLLVVFFYSCQEDTLPGKTDYPFLTINNVTGISSQGAEFTANIINLGNQEIIDYGFVWDDSIPKPSINNDHKSLGVKPAIGKMTFDIKNGLRSGVNYHVRAYIQTDKYIVYSDITEFESKGSNPPKINNFTPLTGSMGTVVKITGENFTCNSNKILVMFGSLTAKVDSSSENAIYMKVPKTLVSDSVKISVKVAGMTAVSDTYFSLYYPWLRKGNYDLFNPVTYSYSDIILPSSFILQNKAYLIGANSMVLNIYNADTDSWTNNINLPEYSGSYPNAFEVNGKGYILIYNDLWEYDPSTGKWISKKSYPGTSTRFTYSFCSENNAYVGDCYYNNKLWQYNSITDTWIEMASYPGVSDYPWGCFSFSVNNRGYVGTNRDGYSIQFWEYNPESNNWVKKSDYPSTAYSKFSHFVIGSKAYLGLGSVENGWEGACSNSIWQYDSTNDTWVSYQDCPKTLAVFTSFTINNKAYVVGLNTYWDNDNTRYVYQFDPAKN